MSTWNDRYRNTKSIKHCIPSMEWPAFCTKSRNSSMEWNTSYGFQNDGKHENETDWDDFQIFIICPAYVYICIYRSMLGRVLWDVFLSSAPRFHGKISEVTIHSILPCNDTIFVGVKLFEGGCSDCSLNLPNPTNAQWCASQGEVWPEI